MIAPGIERWAKMAAEIAQLAGSVKFFEPMHKSNESLKVINKLLSVSPRPLW